MALIASSYHPYFGGVEEHVRQVARELQNAGTPVEVWTVDRGEHLGERVLDGVRVRYLPTPLPARRIGALARFIVRSPRARRAWRSAYEQFSPTMLHVHCFGPNGIYALRLRRSTGTPLAITSHGETLADDNGAFQRSRLLRRGLTDALSRAAFVTAPSQYVLDDLRTRYALTDGTVVPNGVDLSIGPDRKSAAPVDRPYLLGVGRLGRMKGFDLLIEAFAQSGLTASHRLLIAGDGPERDALTGLADSQGIADEVRLLGRLSAQQIADAMSHAQCVVVPSRSEAFGIVALEAWRSSAALIMTSRGGAPGFVHDGVDGLLVDPLDTTALAGLMIKVATDDVLRTGLGRAGHARVGEFTWRRVADDYHALYRSVEDARAVTA
ncbi:glycosyltransferase family 4 protein [Microbacterium terrisoli]|uniref:glycosyltransferase family 4 protein n=1 Tax=Microbacterium terrisoli TaxID=3242192 RepID=UPI0028059BE8|nr:glycosyltransferase family 4 protein [Microbacterium protaetiae]